MAISSGDRFSGATLIGYFQGRPINAVGGGGSSNPAEIVASNDLTAQTAAVSSVTTFTPSGTGTYRIGGYVTVTAVSTDVLNLEVTYTDETSTSRTVKLIPMGATIPDIGATGVFTFPSILIRAAAGAITLKTILATGGGSIAYDVGGVIEVLG